MNRNLANQKPVLLVAVLQAKQVLHLKAVHQFHHRAAKTISPQKLQKVRPPIRQKVPHPRKQVVPLATKPISIRIFPTGNIRTLAMDIPTEQPLLDVENGCLKTLTSQQTPANVTNTKKMPASL